MNFIKSDNAPDPIGPYSQATEWNGLIFTSGQIAIHPETGNIVSEDVEEQTRQVLDNLQAVLKAGNSSLNKVVKTTIFLSDMNNFAG